MKGAAIYARQGWRVMPLWSVVNGACECPRGAECKSAGKHPRIKEWETECSADPDVIAEWASKWPHANVGAATGEASGFFVLDEDPRNGGTESLAALETKHGKLPDTLRAQTPSGGYHYVFRLPDFAVHNSAGKVGAGLDIRGNGGQIVVAPSKTAAGSYRWQDLGTPIADAPAWLLDLIRPRRVQPSVSDYTEFGPATPADLMNAGEALAIHGPAIEGKGGDHHTFVACAMLTHDFALTDAEAWPLLLEWNARCLPPWDEADLAAKLDTGRNNGSGEYGSRRHVDALAMALSMVAAEAARSDSGPLERAAFLESLHRFVTQHPLNPAKHNQLRKEMMATLGLKAKEVYLPGPVDTEAAAERKARQEAFAKGEGSHIDPNNALATAQAYLNEGADGEGLPELVRWQGAFWRSLETHYVELPEENVKAYLYPWLAKRTDLVTGNTIKPDRQLVGETFDAIKSASLLESFVAPAWVRGYDADPADVVPFSNGLLKTSTREILPLTRRFFALNAVGFAYEPNAPDPREWLAFLNQLWPNDAEAIGTLQEIFGLMLTGDTSFQKMFMLIGPMRSGKGTIGRILTAMVGAANTAAPTLGTISTHFGLESLISKTVAVISDARVSQKTDLGAVTENLLRISGEDTVTIPRKHKSDWTAKLSARFLILSNEVPAFTDQSGALSSRFVVLQIRPSFLGKEDQRLTQRLELELPGITQWALDGLDRLRKRGHFVQPGSSSGAIKQLESLSSPVRAFVEDCCTIDPGAETGALPLYGQWTNWVSEQGRAHPGSMQVFARNLTAAFPFIRVTRVRTGETRETIYEGIRLGGTGE